MKNIKGFSLVEIMLVVAVAAIMLVLAVAPSAMLTNKSQFENVKVQLRNALQQARNTARTQQQCVVISVVGQIVTTSIYQYSTPPSCLAGVFVTGVLQSTTSITLPNTVQLGNFILKQPNVPIPNLIFNTTGGTDYNDIVTVVLSAQSYSVQYQIIPLIGQIEEQ